MNIRSRKGTTLVEAAMIFPLVIAAVAAVVYIAVALYLSLSLQTSVHMALRKECGMLTETVYRAQDTKEYEYEKERFGFRSAILMEEQRGYKMNGIFQNRVTRKETERSYVIDEAEAVRISEGIREVLD